MLFLKCKFNFLGDSLGHGAWWLSLDTATIAARTTKRTLLTAHAVRHSTKMNLFPNANWPH